MNYYGNLTQEAIYRTFVETYGRQGLIDLLIDSGQSPKSARDYSKFMANYWDRSERGARRSGATYFERMLYAIVHKPTSLEPTGDYSYLDDYPLFCGEEIEAALLDAEPAFQELYKKTGDPIYEIADYIWAIPRALTVILVVAGNVWKAYLGESDTPIPDDLLEEND